MTDAIAVTSGRIEILSAPLTGPVPHRAGNWLCLLGQTDAGLAEADQTIALDRLAPLGGFVRHRRGDVMISMVPRLLGQ